MPLIADRMQRIAESTTIAITKLAADLREKGKNIISLGAGEPDFDTPENIKEYAISYIKKHDSGKYTNVDGTKDLKIAIQDKLKRENNLHYNLNEIIVSNGAKQVIFNLFMASLNPGDQVIIPAPYWVSYPEIVSLFEGMPILVECNPENNFKLTAQQLEDSITPKTKWCIINSPCNPTGSLYSKSELESLAEVLKHHPHVNIASDDIYEHIIFDNKKFHTLAEIAPELKNRIFIINGVSKTYAMTGWRIGYGIGNAKIVKAMSVIQSQSTSNPSSISQAAALEALGGTQDYIKINAKIYQNKRDLALNIISTIPGMSCIKPEGSFYLFPYCEHLFGIRLADGTTINNSTDFVAYLINAAGVAVVPGIAFGLDKYFRLSYTTSISELEAGCLRIKTACKQLLNH